MFCKVVGNQSLSSVSAVCEWLGSAASQKQLLFAFPHSHNKNCPKDLIPLKQNQIGILSPVENKVFAAGMGFPIDASSLLCPSFSQTSEVLTHAS